MPKGAPPLEPDSAIRDCRSTALLDAEEDAPDIQGIPDGSNVDRSKLRLLCLAHRSVIGVDKRLSLAKCGHLLSWLAIKAAGYSRAAGLHGQTSQEQPFNRNNIKVAQGTPGERDHG